MPFEYIDDIALADVAFLAWGNTLEQMLIAASDATLSVMVAAMETIEGRERRQIEIRSHAVDMLLFNLLQELIFFKDAEQLLLRIEDVSVWCHDGQYEAKATARGERIDPRRHEMLVDIKAVTLHRFQVEQTPRGWEAFVILDI